MNVQQLQRAAIGDNTYGELIKSINIRSINFLYFEIVVKGHFLGSTNFFSLKSNECMPKAFTNPFCHSSISFRWFIAQDKSSTSRKNNLSGVYATEVVSRTVDKRLLNGSLTVVHFFSAICYD